MRYRRCWDAGTGATRATLTGHRTERIWDVAIGVNTATMRVAGGLAAVAISPILYATGARLYRFDLEPDPFSPDARL